MTKRKLAYLNYLESGHWKTLRKQAFKRDGNRCVQCGSAKRLRGHHKRYRKNLRDCTVDDILTLCEKCHNKHHKEQAAQRKLRRQARKQSALNILLKIPIEIIRSVNWTCTHSHSKPPSP